MSENVTQELQTATFGELAVSNKAPITQISSKYGILENTLNVTASSGIVSTVDGQFICETGTSADGFASILTLNQGVSRPGQGLVARFDALFPDDTAGSNHISGLINAETTLVFGYIGDVFGVFYGCCGRTETRILTVSSPATVGENATITINEIPYVVALTNATAEVNAYEISESLKAQVPNYLFTSNGVTVTAEAVISTAQGAFSFVSGTAAATWSQITIGTPQTPDFTPQADWNGEDFDNLDPKKINEYQLYVNGDVKFFIYDSDSKSYKLVHTLKTTNTLTSLVAENPTFRAGWLCNNTSSVINSSVKGSYAALFNDGELGIDKRSNSAVNSATGYGTTRETVLIIRNRININGRINRANILPIILSVATTSSNQAGLFQLVLDPVFSSPVDFQYIDEVSSITEIATDKVEITGGRIIAGIVITKESSSPINLNEYDATILPDTVLAITSAVTSGAAAEMGAAMTFKEDT